MLGSVGVFITAPSIFTDSATCWYSWISPTNFTNGPVTLPASIWKAIRAPTVMSPRNTIVAPSQMMATVISISNA